MLEELRVAVFILRKKSAEGGCGDECLEQERASCG